LRRSKRGVFRDVIDSTIKGLHGKINEWKAQSTVQIDKYFDSVETTFHQNYLGEDQEESEARIEAKRNLRDVIVAAK
jgi:hypothetical protein